MYIGRFQPYYSFATTYGFQFGGKAPPSGFNYDPKTKKLVPATPSAKDNLIDRGDLKSGEAVRPGAVGKSDPNTPYSTRSDGSPARTKNTSSGCENCKAYDYTCEFMKVGCELGHFVEESIVNGGNLKILILIAAGVVGTVLILKK